MKLFDPNKSFLNLGVLWAVVFIHFLLAVIISVAIVAYSNLSFDPSFEGFNNFIYVFKLPLGILALIIPIVALLAANHRSEQTREQMRIANQQNVFSNYYKHVEEFEKYCGKIETPNLTFDSPRHLHGLIFTEAHYGVYKASISIKNEVDEFLGNFIHSAECLECTKEELWIKTIVDLSKIIRKLNKKFSIKSKPITGNEIKYEGGSVVVPKGNVKYLLISMKDTVYLIDKLFEFDTEYIPSNTVSDILNYNYKSLPDSNIKELKNYTPLTFKPRSS